MAQNAINVRLQSRRLVEIRDLALQGTNISHLLNVMISNQTDYADAFQSELKKRIFNIPHVLNVPHNGGMLQSVSITWLMNDTQATNDAYFYGVNLPYIDEVIGTHTRLMLTMVTRAIRKVHPEYGIDWSVTYSVTKPLTIKQAMPQIGIEN